MDAEEKMKRCLERAIGGIQEFNVLWEIDFPLLLSLRSGGKRWLAYVTKYSRRYGKVELVLSLTDDQAIQDMLSNEKPIREVMTEQPYWMNKWTLDLGEGTIKADNVLEELILALLPDETFTLSPLVPNRMDVSEESA